MKVGKEPKSSAVGILVKKFGIMTHLKPILDIKKKAKIPNV